uniref:Uncharacterized protein n=1 Tax=Oryza sativa subsp. japonica TaxID=39947 RepID=Q69IS0_ORYSJ|nr:hypothetical protein [Oryza sativa Japonica Group]
MALARGGGPRWTGSTDRGGGGAPRGADVAPTRRPLVSHAGGETDGPDLPPGRSDGGGGSRTGGPGQLKPARRPWHAAAQRDAAAAQGGERAPAESGDDATTTRAAAMAKLTGVRCEAGAGEGMRQRRAGRSGLHDGECDGVDGTAASGDQSGGGDDGGEGRWR